jgi:hypothetical protein
MEVAAKKYIEGDKFLGASDIVGRQGESKTQGSGGVYGRTVWSVFFFAQDLVLFGTGILFN